MHANLAVDQVVVQADSNVLSIPQCPERRVARNVAFSIDAIEMSHYSNKSYSTDSSSPFFISLSEKSYIPRTVRILSLDERFINLVSSLQNIHFFVNLHR